MSHYLPDLHSRLELAVKTPVVTEDGGIEKKLSTTTKRALEMANHPEVQMFIYIILLMKLIDDGDLKQAKEFGEFIFLRLKNVSLRTLDHLSAKALYFVSVVYEKLGLLSEIRPMMFEAYKISCLRHDQIG